MISNQRTDQETAVWILENFASSAELSFDRLLATRAVNEATRAIPGEGPRTWASRLLEAGESVNLRIRTVDASINEILQFLRQQLPVCAPLAGEPGYLLLLESRGGKVRVVAPTDDGPRWIALRKLSQLLEVANRTERRNWIVGQAAFPCFTSSRLGDTMGRGMTPFRRVLGMIRTERSDLWAVVIFSVVVGFLALASPIAVEALVNTVAFGRYLQPVIVLSGILLIFLGFAGAIRALNTFIVEVIQRRIFVRVVEDLAYRLPRVEQSALDGHYGPELVNRFFDVVTVQKVAAKLLLDGTALVLQTVIGMIVLAFYHPFLLGFDAVLLFLIAAVMWVLGRGAVKTAIKESKAKYKMAAWLEELIRNPSAFKLNGGANFGLLRADNLAVGYLESRKGHFAIVLRQVVFALGLEAFAATALLGLGGWLVIQGELTLGQLVAAELIVMMIVGSFTKLGKQLEGFYDLLASTDKLGALFDLPVEPHDRLFHAREGMPATLSAHRACLRVGGRTIHKNLSFQVAQGDSLAVVGPPGSGKSMLVEMLCALRQPSDGHIELDGIDLRQLRPDSLREHVGVARGVEIFHGTIDENVHLNRPQINASDVREALDSVGLLDDVMELPDGLSTMLQTEGSPLSNSQSLRLMLARAIVGRPRLLLIDGSLDSLGNETLARVLDGICGPDKPWTLLITTTREETAKRCAHVFHLARVHDEAKIG